MLPILLVSLCVMPRVVPHPPNFAPVGATAVFAGRTMKAGKSDFHVPVRQGQLVELHTRVVAPGKTSITVEVDLYSEDLVTRDRQLGTRGRFVLVALDVHGKPTGVPPLRGASPL